MKTSEYNVYFFLASLLGISVVTYFIFQPFFLAIMLAGILAMALQRPYLFLVKKTNDNKSLSSLLISLFGVVTLTILLGLIVGILTSEINFLYRSTVAQGNSYAKYAQSTIDYVNQNPLMVSLGFENVINKETLVKSMSQLGQSAFVLVQKAYQGIASGTFFFAVVFFTLYFLLIEGKNFVSWLAHLIPLKHAHKKILFGKFVSITRATAKGALIIAVIQGSIGMTLFLILGIPSAFILGIAMMFFSLIPVVGTGLIWFPAAMAMFLTGNIWQGWGILLVGVGIISTIDNFLRPKLVGKDTQMHPLIVFFASLGGVNLFGIFGLIVGPIIVALFLSLWEIYASEFRGDPKPHAGI
ncbi:MAG: AI-2E family transporter [Candidatus Moraniibacteriota bacterium]